MKQSVVPTLGNVSSTTQDHLKNQNIINISFSLDPLSRLRSYKRQKDRWVVNVKFDYNKYDFSES